MATGPRKFVRKLSVRERERLQQARDHGATRRLRQRAHAILLSADGMTRHEIAAVFDVTGPTVSSWIDRWNETGLDGLDDAPRSGAPPRLTPEERTLVIDLLQEFPRSSQQVLAEIERRLGRTISARTLRRIARSAGFRWKRMRRSLRHRRDEREFHAARKDLEDMVQAHQRGEIELRFFDESGFSRDPVVPYGWQPIGHCRELPTEREPTLTVLGLWGYDQSFECYTVQGSVDATCVVGCFDAFCQTLRRPTVVVLDNSPVHTSHEFQQHLSRWEVEGLECYYLPPYSPELNLIEILWKQIKHRWLPLCAYNPGARFRDYLHDVLVGIGTRFRINHSFLQAV